MEIKLLTIASAIIGFIISISILVIFHELGHFWAARSVGVKVDRFAIGLGKTLFKFTTKKNLEIAINIVPLGGYVTFDENYVKLNISFRKYLLSKTWIVVAGPLANLLLAFVILIGLYSVIGMPAIQTSVASITPKSIAAHAGLQPNMMIVQVGHIKTPDAKMLLNAFLLQLGSTKKINIIVRDSNNIQHTIIFDLKNWSLSRENPYVFNTLGFSINQSNTHQFVHHHAFFNAIKYGVNDAWLSIKLTAILLWKLIAGKIPLSLFSGPLIVAESAGIAISLGLSIYLSFLAFLSINLAVFNALPIPGLDGGQLVFICIEAVKNQALSEYKKALIVQISIGAGIILFAHIIAQDLRMMLS